MATITGLLTINGINIISVSSVPDAGAGTVAPTGSYAFLTDGSAVYLKQSATDTDWRKIAFSTTAINTQTASYTLVITDDSKLIQMNVGTANNVTVPPNSSVEFPVGTSILFEQLGTGQTTFVAGAGVTINSNGGRTKLSAQYAAASLIKTGTDVWMLSGDIAT